MNMMVEYAAGTVAVGTRKPRFSWTVPFQGRNRRQSGYHILVATSEELLTPTDADLWNSGKVYSAQSVNIPYEGKELQSSMDCYWAVCVWDESGRTPGFSAARRFETALYDEADWKGIWIGMGDPDEPYSDPDTFQQERVPPEIASVEPDLRAPLIRREFRIDKTVRRARAYVCGLGLFELRLNGAKAGDDVLSTPRTDFRKRVIYSTYDVTRQISTGENAIGLILGNGWFNGQKRYWGWQMQWYGSPRAIVQLQIEFEDRSRMVVCSDETWRADWSPITFNCIYDGEDYDARLEQPGWDAPGFDAANWAQVHAVAAPGGELVPAICDPGMVTEHIRPVSLTEPTPGVFIYDLGRNITGWVRIELPGCVTGSEVKLRYAEAIYENGTLNTSSNGNGRQEDNYIAKGGDVEIYEPRFTYHGFRYVEVTGFPGVPDQNAISGHFVRTAVAQTGTFECGSDLINRIHQCTVQSQLCNIQMGVPTDDTQRPERLGWGADAWATANEALYNLWMPRLYTKWIADFRDQQDETGMIGMIAPQAGSEEDLVWSSAFLLIPWWQYLHCGDRRILEENYESFQRYIEFLKKTGVDSVDTAATDEVIGAILWRCGPENRFPAEHDRGHLQISQWGDHLATAEGSSSRANLPLSIATAFYFLDISTMAEISRVLGREVDARHYLSLAAEVKNAFNARFLDSDLGYYDTGVQSAQAWPLSFGLVPEDQHRHVSEYFHHSVDQRQRRLTTGYAGTKYAIQALSECGHNATVWKLATATGYPSWGYMLKGNQTTSTEHWDGESGSLNHAPLGAAIDEWFYWGLAGICPDAAGPGYERIVFKPYLPPDLSWVRATVKSVRGLIVSDWRKNGNEACLSVTVPANSSSIVYIPTENAGHITEGGKAVTAAPGVKVLQCAGGESILETGSGTFHFTFPWPYSTEIVQ